MIPFNPVVITIYICCITGLLWAAFNFWQVSKVDLLEGTSGEYTQLSDDGGRKKSEVMMAIGEYIAKGANAFLYQEYRILAIFCLAMALVIKFFVDSIGDFGTTIAFAFGCATSIISGFIGMRVAVFSNYRVAYKAQEPRTGLAEAFKVAFRAGCVMGFALTSLSLLVMTTIVLIYRATYGVDGNFEVSFINPENKEGPYPSSPAIINLYEAMAGYGLGGSTIALFGRVGGGIYTKAADVGADLVGKVEQDLPEDSPKNPATIADNVGDNVGDIAGMGSDLFGSFAESTCAALVVLSSGSFQRFYGAYVAGCNQYAEWPGGETNIETCANGDVYLMYPLFLSALGIIACLLCSIVATNIMDVNQFEEIEKTLRYQLIISATLLALTLYIAAELTLNTDGVKNQYSYNNEGLPITIAQLEAAGFTVPTSFEIPDTNANNGAFYYLTVFNAYACTLSGLIVGLLIGLLTEYYTSNNYDPVKEVAESCKTGAATNIIYGLALGYLSCVIPVILLAIAAYISHKTLGLFGIALAALGMLANLCVGLAVDAYGPISDNAGGIAEMSELGEETRHRTDALDAAGNTTAAIGKGFAIGSAAFVSMSLYGAFITRARRVIGADYFVIQDVEVTDALLFSGLLVGAMLPYAFSAMTMKSVGKAALQMVYEIRRQLAENPKIKTGEQNPDYERCVAISTQASLKEMIGPGALVILSPIVVGMFFGPRAVAGLLPGALVSGVQMAISASNTGGAWDNAKKYIESGKLFDGDVPKKKGSDEHKAAVIGDTVGDPLKDTSGPSLNILVKLSAILSLVFTPFFQRTGFLVCALNENPNPVPGSRTC